MDSERAVACDCIPEVASVDWLRVGLGLVISGQVMLLSLALNLSETPPDTRTSLSQAVVGLTTVALVLLGPDLLSALRDSYRRRDLSLDALFALALSGGLGVSIWGLATGGPVFFEVATVVLAVHAVGRLVKGRAWASAIARVHAAQIYPETAHRLESMTIDDVSVSDLVQGDVCVVYPGERIPVDAMVTGPGTWVVTSAVDGQRTPQWRHTGASIAAGALVVRDPVHVEVLATDDTTSSAAESLQLLVDASQRDVPQTGLSASLARLFVPMVATVAVVAGVAWAFVDGSTTGFVVGTSVLLVACPCGFGIATPVALWAASESLARNGVRVQRLGALEDLASARIIVFDKTGTLTEIEDTVQWSSGVSDTVKNWVGALQQSFNHPVAALLRSGGLQAPAVQAAHALPNGGVRGRVYDGASWRQVDVLPQSGRRGVTVHVDNIHVADVALSEGIRRSAASTLDALAELGLSTHILTGDTVDPGLGIDCSTGLAPEQKALWLGEQSGPTVFVGDGINDLPAMATADVSVAVGQAEALVESVADIVVDDVQHVLTTLRAARAVHARLHRLLLGSITLNIIGIAVAAAGLLHPVFAATLMAMTSLGVTLFALPGETS